jgi:hypothetical protein
MELLPHSLTAALWPNGIRSLIRKARFLPVCSFQCSTPVGNTRRQPKSCFGENQLLRNSISFSLLTTSHPMVLYGQPVRASTGYYPRFTLLMASSSRFGSHPCPRTEQHRYHKREITFVVCFASSSHYFRLRKKHSNFTEHWFSSLLMSPARSKIMRLWIAISVLSSSFALFTLAFTVPPWAYHLDKGQRCSRRLILQ